MQTESIGFNKDDISFIETALNFYWNNAHINLLRKDLGDIEERNYKHQLSMSKHLMERINQNSNQFTASKSMAIALQDGIQMLSIGFPSEIELIEWRIKAEESLKQAGLQPTY